jgi:hypothetical protein
MSAKSWREIIKVHPAADTFEMMSESELEVLVGDIEKHGLHVPLILWTSDHVEQIGRKAATEPYLLDGRNRLEAIWRSEPDPEEREDAIRNAIYWQGGLAQLHYGDTDPWEIAISANILRRHLTTAQKSDLITALLKANPARSDRATAKIAKVDKNTIAAKRQDLEARGEIHHVEKRVDTKGRSQPATKPARSDPDAIPETQRRLAEAATVAETQRRPVDSAPLSVDQAAKPPLAPIVHRSDAEAEAELRNRRAKEAFLALTPTEKTSFLKWAQAAKHAPALTTPTDKTPKIKAALAAAGNDGLTVGELYNKTGAYLTDLDLAVKQGLIREAGERYFAVEE